MAHSPGSQEDEPEVCGSYNRARDREETAQRANLNGSTILLIGSGADGAVFSEETHTVVLGLHGAGIVSRNQLIVEQELILRDARRNREAEVRVAGEIARQGEEHTNGVAFLDEHLDFWGTEFPASPAAAAKSFEPEAKPEEFVALAEAMEGVNRRSRVRAKVNCFACVKTEKFGEEIVKCIDMSRGGVSFRSKNAFAKGMKLQIAVSFSPEQKQAPAIFVRGQVAKVMTWGEECGGAGWSL